MQKWDLLAHSFLMRPTSSVEGFIYQCIWKNHQKIKENTFLADADRLKDVDIHLYIAFIFSCLVNFRPVGAGRIFVFMAEVKIWWAIKIKGWVRALNLHLGVLTVIFEGFAFHLPGGSQEMFPLIQFQRKLFQVKSVFRTVLVKKTYRL